MYSDTVTVFCCYESSDEAIWYPYVLSGVNLNMDRGAILKKYGPGSTDNAQLHIEYRQQDSSFRGFRQRVGKGRRRKKGQLVSRLAMMIFS